ncbi:hypothetical protein AAVH_03348 [Aphelenchoides avenae]|nr:hypothetical protein AAVH_03348 [Aphelenchus avenae]
MTSTSNRSDKQPGLDAPEEPLLDGNANTNDPSHASHVSNVSTGQPTLSGAPADGSYVSQQTGKTSATYQPKQVSTNFLCCNVFIWVKAFGVLSLVVSFVSAILWFFALKEDAFFPHQQVLTFICSGLGMLIAIGLLVNAFVLHRAVLYMVLAMIHAVVAVLVLGFFGFAIFIFAVESGDCAKRVGSDCGSTATTGLALCIISLLAALAIQGLFVFVLVKASLVQRNDDGVNLG